MRRSRGCVVVSAVVVGLLMACGTDDVSRGSSSMGTRSQIDSAPTSSEVPAAPPPTSPPAASAMPNTDVDAAPFLGSLTFDWPVGCAVPVEEHVSKRDIVGLIHYTVRTRASDAGIEISLDDMTIDEVNGVPVPANMLDQLVASFTLPAFVVGADGVGIGTVNMDETIARMDELGMIEADDFTPEAIAIVEDTVLTKYWGSWVGLWAELGSIDEEFTQLAVPVRIGDIEVTMDVVVESIASVLAGQATLRSVQTMKGDDFLISIGAVQQQMGAAQPLELQGEGHRVTTIIITSDPTTLRPSTASYSTEVELTMDGETKTETEQREWRFDWSNLQCD